MKWAIALVMALVIPGAALGQAVVLDVSGAQPGRYYFQVNVATGGIIAVSPLTQVISLTKPGPVPPPQPDVLTKRSVAIRDAAARVTGDSERAATASALAAVYRELGLKITDGTIKGQEAAAFGVKHTTDLLLTARKVKEPWDATRVLLTSYWAELVQEGGKDADYATLLNEAAIGLEASCVNEQPQIDLEMILQIIKLVIELIEKFF